MNGKASYLNIVFGSLAVQHKFLSKAMGKKHCLALLKRPSKGLLEISQRNYYDAKITLWLCCINEFEDSSLFKELIK